MTTPAHIGICMPFYSAPHPATVSALAALEETSIHSYAIHQAHGYPNIDHARAIALIEWLYDSRHTHLLTLDADVWWQPGSIDQLVARDKPVVCGAYPFKAPEGHPLHRRAVAVAFPQAQQDPLSPLLRLRRVGAGFMLLKTTAVQRLLKLHRELRFHLPVNLASTGNVGKLGYALWLPYIYPNPDGYLEYLTDDWAFCQRLLDAGYDIHCDPTVRLRHCEPGQVYHELNNEAEAPCTPTL